MPSNRKSLFHNLPSQDQKEFISKLIHAIGRDNEAYYDAVKIVTASEGKKHFDDVKFFNRNIYGEGK